MRNSGVPKLNSLLRLAANLIVAIKPAIAAFSIGAIVSETALSATAAITLSTEIQHFFESDDSSKIALSGGIIIALLLMARFRAFHVRVEISKTLISKLDTEDRAD